MSPKNEKTSTLNFASLRCFEHWKKNQYLIQFIVLSINDEIFKLLENYGQNVNIQDILVI